MSDLETRLTSLEHSRTTLKTAIYILGLFGIGISGYATYLSSKLSSFDSKIAQAETTISTARQSAIDDIAASKADLLAAATSAAARHAKAEVALALEVGERPLEVKQGGQYPGHGKLLASVEGNGRVTLSGLFGQLPKPPAGGLVIARLPTDLCPDQPGVFDVAVHPIGTARLDIGTNGELRLLDLNALSKERWDPATRGKSWLSLDGVSFFRAQDCIG